MRFVEETSVTVASGGAAASAARTVSAAAPTGTATTTSSAPGDRVGEGAGGGIGGAERAGLGEHAGVEVEAGRLPDARTPRGEADRRAEQAGADDREPLDTGRGRGPRGGPGRPCGRELLLHQVEHRREDRRHRTLGERALVLGRERAQELRLALGVEPACPDRVLVLADAADEVEPAVERVEERPVDRTDLGAQLSSSASLTGIRSPASIAAASRFPGGASGHTQPGS